jgi:hypothetical protein
MQNSPSVAPFVESTARDSLAADLAAAGQASAKPLDAPNAAVSSAR